MSSKQFVVIGLGRFGSSVAKTLYSLGNDVLAIDKVEDKVQNISDSVTHAVQADATDEHTLKALAIRNFDTAVVSIGTDIQSSIMITLLLKEKGVGYVIAKAQSEQHANILYKVGADRAVLPERDLGVRIANNISSSNILDYIDLSPDYSIVEICAIPQWENKTLAELNLRTSHGVNVIAIKRGNDINAAPKADDSIRQGDILVVIGGTKDLNRIDKIKR